MSQPSSQQQRHRYWIEDTDERQIEIPNCFLQICRWYTEQFSEIPHRSDLDFGPLRSDWILPLSICRLARARPSRRRSADISVRKRRLSSAIVIAPFGRPLRVASSIAASIWAIRRSISATVRLTISRRTSMSAALSAMAISKDAACWRWARVRKPNTHTPARATIKEARLTVTVGRPAAL
ncbi:hypothetical protein [Bradyrhizobium sp. HKCCYLRH3061]|uniref:hypothetical protein n=1 Tax=Bradyrhizobium sp. HKCCYLRH3061 TaxID=3420734 RepID=UPI003EB8023A